MCLLNAVSIYLSFETINFIYVQWLAETNHSFINRQCSAGHCSTSSRYNISIVWDVSEVEFWRVAKTRGRIYF